MQYSFAVIYETPSRYLPLDGVKLYLTKHNGYPSSERKVTNQELDDFCLNESETKRFPFELGYPLCFVYIKDKVDIYVMNNR